MPHILDNMIWNAISTGNRDIALLDGDVGCYQPDIAPFVGLKELNDESLKKLHDFISADRRVAIAYFNKISLDKNNPIAIGWEVIRQMECCQMVYEYPMNTFTTAKSHLIVPLTAEHVPQMLELTRLTKPGPFLQRTIEFGNYFGIFIDGRLAAMTGQRMHPLPYMEVSAVCTHSDFRGKGYAKACMLHVMKLILDNSFIPFLHVLTSNASAIALYESIGFRTRTKLNIDMIKRL
ncbi:MAG: GNAT family N-acetyltransferase [Bacteroidota bacterium]